MPRIGLRALQNRMSEVLRQGSRHESVYHALPAAELTPVGQPSATTSASANENWDELTRLGQQIAEGWPAGVTSADVLSEIRQ